MADRVEKDATSDALRRRSSIATVALTFVNKLLIDTPGMCALPDASNTPSLSALTISI